MTVFAEKNPLELAILAAAIVGRPQARLVLDILDRASWNHKVAYTAIEQVARHGKILDQHVRDHPHVTEALLRRSNPVASRDLEKLCWNHLFITNTDQQMALFTVAARPGYEDLRAVLGEILAGNLEAFDTPTETMCTTSSDELSPSVSAMIDSAIVERREAAAALIRDASDEMR